MYLLSLIKYLLQSLSNAFWHLSHLIFDGQSLHIRPPPNFFARLLLSCRSWSQDGSSRLKKVPRHPPAIILIISISALRGPAVLEIIYLCTPNISWLFIIYLLRIKYICIKTLIPIYVFICFCYYLSIYYLSIISYRGFFPQYYLIWFLLFTYYVCIYLFIYLIIYLCSRMAPRYFQSPRKPHHDCTVAVPTQAGGVARSVNNNILYIYHIHNI